MSATDTSKAQDDPQTSLDHLPEHLRSRIDFDLLVPKDGVLLPCYSQVLAVKSKMIAQMLEDTAKEGWGAGVAGALADASLEDAQRFLAVCHHHEGTNAFSEDIELTHIEAVVRIAHKLDAPAIIQECGRCLVSTTKYLEDPVRWLGIAGTEGLPDVADRCRAVVLERLMQDANHADVSTRKVCGNGGWNDIPPEEYERLMNGLLRAFNRGILPIKSYGKQYELPTDSEWSYAVARMKPFE